MSDKEIQKDEIDLVLEVESEAGKICKHLHSWRLRGYLTKGFAECLSCQREFRIGDDLWEVINVLMERIENLEKKKENGG